MFKHAMILSTLTCTLAFAGLGCDIDGPAEDESAVALASAAEKPTVVAYHVASHGLPLYIPAAWASEVTSVTGSTPAPSGDEEAVGLGVVAASDEAIQGDAAAIQAALQTYGECAMECSEHPSAIPTNSETCSLQCQNLAESAGIAAGSPAHALIDNFDECLDQCDHGSFAKDTNRETCRLNCDAVYDTKAAELGASAADLPPTKRTKTRK